MLALDFLKKSSFIMTLETRILIHLSDSALGWETFVFKISLRSLPFDAIKNDILEFWPTITKYQCVKTLECFSFLDSTDSPSQFLVLIGTTSIFTFCSQYFLVGLASSQIASSVFTLGTVAVLPFYTLMVVAPKAELTKKCMESSLPYVVLGILYAYLLYLSWTPDTIRLMFASKYWLPELPGIARMFSNEMTLASAWIHLLAVDLFAARQVFQDGLENEIETRHSVSLCLLFCPIGIVTHAMTKALTKSVKNTKHIM